MMNKGPAGRKEGRTTIAANARHPFDSDTISDLDSRYVGSCTKSDNVTDAFMSTHLTLWCWGGQRVQLQAR